MAGLKSIILSLLFGFFVDYLLDFYDKQEWNKIQICDRD